MQNFKNYKINKKFQFVVLLPANPTLFFVAQRKTN